MGNEIDLLANFHITSQQDLTVGYSELFAGDFIRQTGPGQNPRRFYVLLTSRW